MTNFNRPQIRVFPVAGGCAGLLLAALAAGCGPNGGASGGQRVPTTQSIREEALKNAETIVLRVVAYYQPPYRWSWTEDKSRVIGLGIGSLYLEGPKGKGVFGDGTLHAKLYVRDRQALRPQDQYRLLKEWSFEPEDLFLWRTRKPTIQGNGYMLPLNWADLNVDLDNQEIRVIIGYTRSDGLSVPPSTKDLLVPSGRG